MNYGNWVLNQLLDKYEKSKAFTDFQSLKRVMITVSKCDKLCERLENSDEKSLFLHELSVLKKQKVLDYSWVKYEQGNLVDKIWLLYEEQENLIKAYEFVGRQPKKHFLGELLDRMEQAVERVQSNQWVEHFLKECIFCINQNQKVPRLFTDSMELNTAILKALVEIDGIEQEILERVFSMRCYGDSKYFERKVRSKLISIIKYVFEQSIDEDITQDEILSLVGISKYPEVMEFCGNISVRLENGAVIDYSIERYGAYINSRLVAEVNCVGISNIHRILFIENKANYIWYVLNQKQEDELVIYHGGFYSPMKRVWFEKIYATAKPLRICIEHWSDIDYGGFQIFCRLKKIVPTLQPYLMDCDTLIKYHNYTQSISSKSYTDKLKKLLEKDDFNIFYNVIQLMLEENVRLEQEAFIVE